MSLTVGRVGDLMFAKIAMTILGVSVLNAFASPSMAEVRITRASFEVPSDKTVSFGEVYGTVRYKVKIDANVVGKLLEKLSDSYFSTRKEGSILVTLALYGSDLNKPISERALISGSKKSNSFLWLTTSETVSDTLDLNGSLIDYVMVDSTTNKMRIKLRFYFSSSSSFDPKVYSELFKLSAAAGVANMLALPALVLGNSDSFAKIVEATLNRVNSEEIVLGSEMSFISLGGADAPHQQRFSASFKDRDSTVRRFSVEVIFSTEASKIGVYDTSRVAPGEPRRRGWEKFAIQSKFLDSAKVSVGSNQIAVAELIEKAGRKDVSSGVSMLRGGAYDSAKNAGLSVSVFCDEYYKLVKTAFTERDSIAIYWDMLLSMKDGLNKSVGGRACVENKQSLMELHGLPMSPLSSIQGKAP